MRSLSRLSFCAKKPYEREVTATSTSRSLGQRILPFAFVAYAVLSLGSMATMSVGAAILAAAILLAKAWPRLAGHRFTRAYLWLALALSIALLVSLLAAMAMPLEYGGRHASVSLGKDMAKAWYLFWPLLLVGGLRAIREEDRRRALKAWLIAFGALSAIGIIQYFTGWPRPQPIPTNPGRFHATVFLGHHLSLASIFIFPFFATLEAFRAAKPILPRPLLGAILVVGLSTIFLSYSRMVWVALPLGLLLWILLALPKRMALAAAAGLVLVGAAITQAPAIKTRLTNGMGISTRQDLWRANLEFFKERPLTGTGWHHNLKTAAYYFSEKFPERKDHFVGHAHNNAIEMLGSTGLIGIVAWLAWCAGGIGFAYAAYRRAPGSLQGALSRGMLCAWAAFHVNGLTQVNFWESKVLHQMMWVVAWTLLWVEGESET